MRPELELIETIEDFLNGRLSAEEMATFRRQIAVDPDLREKVQLQEEIMKGVERASLTQKVKSAGRNYHYGNSFRKWGLGGSMAIVVVTAAVLLFNYWKDNSHTKYEGLLSLYNESGSKEWSDADRKIAPQVFSINGGHDTVIETKGGITFSIPANGFLYDNGKPATGQINLIVKEALDAGTILKSGLSTQSEGRLLETGGMFYIDARTGDDILKIDPAKGIYAGVPSDTIKPGMQLFQGKRMKDGSIDWINPRPIAHDLTPVNIRSLNFYPPFYLDSLKAWGYDATNKKFTDSLYYSFAAGFGGHPLATVQDEAVGIHVDKPLKDSLYLKPDTLIPKSIHSPIVDCGINPAKIKAIWSENFQNSFIATREFEQRLALIHEIRNPYILDLYINNLDKNLSELDSIAAEMGVEGVDCRSRFLAFAARHDGNVRNNSPQFQKLREYYQNKTKAYTNAITKTQNEFWDKQRKLDNIYYQKSGKNQADSFERISQNFEEELTLNLKDAYHQLGYDITFVNKIAAQPTYNVVITNTGWNNVDKYVFEATENRQDMSYTDPQTGKTATLKYSPVEFNIVNPGQYDQLYLYLLPDKLSSYMRVAGSNGKFTEKLNDLMEYDLVCIAYKGEHPFFYSRKGITPGTYAIELKAIDQSELDSELKIAGQSSKSSGILEEIDFVLYKNKDLLRQQNNQSLFELVHRIEPFIFCNKSAADLNEYVGPESVPAK